MLIAVSLLVALVGMLAFALSANPKIAELGRVAFHCGLLAFLLCLCTGGEKMLGILPK